MISLMMTLVAPQVPPIPLAPEGTLISAYVNGTKLLGMCQAEPEGPCQAYIVGMLDIISSLQTNGAMKMTVCLPPATKAYQARDVVIKFLTDHPKVRDADAAGVSLVALAIAFPCPKGAAAPQ